MSGPSGMETPKNTYRNTLFLSLGLFLILCIACLLPIHPNDYWWYVRIGRDIAAQGAIPVTETLSYTQAGQPVLYQTWLASLIFWGADVLGGATLTTLLRAGLVGGFYTMVWLILRQAGTGAGLSSLITLAAGLAGSNNWAMRPQLFAYPLFGLTLWALLRWQQGKNDRLWILPAATVLWVNLHGSFLLQFMVAGAAVAAGQGNRRKLLAAMGFMGLASLINPAGMREWPYVLGMLVNPSIQRFSWEWGPPINEGWQMNLFFGWLLVMPILAAIGRGKIERLKWLWFLGLGWMALTGLRYVIWFSVVLALITGEMLAGCVEKYVGEKTWFNRPGANLAIGMVLLVLPLALLPGIREPWWKGAPPAYSENTPMAATAWLADHPELEGPLFGDLVFSSYLTAALPERQVWIHTRFEAFPPEQFERYDHISNAAPGWQEMLDEEGINLLFLNLENQPNLSRAVGESALWREVYRDERGVILTREKAIKGETR